MKAELTVFIGYAANKQTFHVMRRWGNWNIG